MVAVAALIQIKTPFPALIRPQRSTMKVAKVCSNGCRCVSCCPAHGFRRAGQPSSGAILPGQGTKKIAPLGKGAVIL